MIFKPMLAATIEDVKLLRYPLIVSPKLDGLRCLMQDGSAVSRNLKPFRNAHVQKCLQHLPDGLDGELIVGSPTEGNVLGRTQSGIMAATGNPEFNYWIFDNYADKQHVFKERYLNLEKFVDLPYIKIVRHYLVRDADELRAKEEDFLAQGYEGLMARASNGTYKEGRSTLNDGLLGKLKRFRDGEAVVMALEEGHTNLNEATEDALGRLKRSSHADNMYKAGVVGTIIAKDLQTEQVLQISPGRMTHDMRKHYWLNKHLLIGQIIKFKTFDYGSLDAPRFSTFQAFRDADDM